MFSTVSHLKATPTKTPYEHWFNSKPDISHLRVFGCDAYLHVPKEERSKFESKSLKCCFVSYADTQKGFRLWDPVHRKVKIGRDVRFDEQLSSKQRSSTHRVLAIQLPQLSLKGAGICKCPLDMPPSSTLCLGRLLIMLKQQEMPMNKKNLFMALKVLIHQTTELEHVNKHGSSKD